jgi:two-component system, OmpR family, sensor histidine kinase MtrB
VREMGLRRRVVLGFAGGALLLSITVTLVTDVASGRYLVDQRDRSATRQAVVNGAFVASQLPSEDPDLSGALETLRLASGTEAVITTPHLSVSSAVGLSAADLPHDLVARAASGESGLERYRDDGTAKVAVAVPFGDGRTYFEVSDLSSLDITLRAIELAGVVAALLAGLLGAALGAWLTRRALRPLADVATTATRLASGDLSARTQTTTDPDLAPISSSFNAMAETLSARIQRDAQFAADVSHELRSPLTTMMASASVLEARREAMPDSAQQATDLLVTDLARFSALLEDLLDLARDHDPLDYANLPVFDLADTARQELASSWRSDLVEASGDTRIRADQRRIRRVVANLVQNADVHGGGLTAVSVRRVAGGVRLSVSDEGLGVPESDREAVFERFSRGRSAPLRGDRGGTGLGLALVRDHVTAHGGAAWYEEAPSGGACFVVELPAAR